MDYSLFFFHWIPLFPFSDKPMRQGGAIGDISMGMSLIKMNKSTQLESSLLHNNPRISIVNIKNNGSKFTEFSSVSFCLQPQRSHPACESGAILNAVKDDCNITPPNLWWKLWNCQMSSFQEVCRCKPFWNILHMIPHELCAAYSGQMNKIQKKKTCEEYIADKYEDYIERFPFTTNQNNLGLVKIHLPMLV